MTTLRAYNLEQKFGSKMHSRTPLKSIMLVRWRGFGCERAVRLKPVSSKAAESGFKPERRTGSEQWVTTWCFSCKEQTHFGQVADLSSCFHVLLWIDSSTFVCSEQPHSVLISCQEKHSTFPIEDVLPWCSLPHLFVLLITDFCTTSRRPSHQLRMRTRTLLCRLYMNAVY